MYKAIGSRGSRVSRVLWMLEELGQPYEFVEVKLRSPEAYALNPSGKVPILIDGELTVTDSAAICVYLADKHADKGMGANPGVVREEITVNLPSPRTAALRSDPKFLDLVGQVSRALAAIHP